METESTNTEFTPNPSEGIKTIEIVSEEDLQLSSPTEHDCPQIQEFKNPENLSTQARNELRKTGQSEPQKATAWQGTKNAENSKAKKRKNEIDRPGIEDGGFRSSFTKILTLFEKISKDITDKHKEVIQRTPFADFFTMFLEKKISKETVVRTKSSVVQIIQLFDKKEQAFIIPNGKRIQLKPEHIALTFGLSLKGKQVQLFNPNRFRNVEDFEKKYFGNIESEAIKKKHIEDRIMEQLKKVSNPEDIEDFVKLLIMHSCSCLFFPKSGGTLPKSFLSHIATIDTINSISWPKVIYNTLISSLNKFHQKPTSVTGCTYQLTYFILETCQIASMINGKERDIPRASRWNLKEFADNDIINKLKAVNTEQVFEDYQLVTDEEQHLLKIHEEQDMVRRQENDSANFQEQIKRQENNYSDYQEQIRRQEDNSSDLQDFDSIDYWKKQTKIKEDEISRLKDERDSALQHWCDKFQLFQEITEDRISTVTDSKRELQKDKDNADKEIANLKSLLHQKEQENMKLKFELGKTLNVSPLRSTSPFNPYTKTQEEKGNSTPNNQEASKKSAKRARTTE